MVVTRYEYSIAGTYGSIGGVYSTKQRGQNFTLGIRGTDENHTLTKIVVYIYKNGSPADSFHIDLYAVDGDGYPTGGSLSNGSVSAGDVPTGDTNIGWVTCNMSSYELVASTKYVFVCSSPSSVSGNDYQMGFTSVDEYSGGVNVYNLGSGWQANSSADAGFEEWGEPTGGSASFTDKICGVVAASIGKVNGVLLAGIGKVDGVS